ncbi:hypothetical protein GIS00_24400 [Nakamurella sp. YIM 132087]|uniref:Uncharacterized protein n=1 Tax=Nakamurella alba TaxID=2665158 RepID=A0A7K1FSI8_9ACTN|nr:hypothetical protein [Nakamurella alba]MTD17081.1 hypothetical protein [Nakamurella alba]
MRPTRSLPGPAAILLVGAVLVAGCTSDPVSLPSFVTGTSGGSGAASVTSTAATTGAGTPTTPSSAASTAGSVTSPPPTRSSLPQSTSTPSAGAAFTVGPTVRLPFGTADEASGLVDSSIRPGTWFTIDDGTGVDHIVAIDGTTGEVVADFVVEGLDASNAEALAPGPCGADDPTRCLYIGDIGDNAERRESITITQLHEPDPRALTDPLAALPATSWDYTYPDGPHNAEAMVVAPDGDILIITKSAPDEDGTVPPHLLFRGEPGGGTLEQVGSVTPPDPARRLQSLLTGTVVTDAAYADGRLLLLTYDEVVEYTAPGPDADLADFPTWPSRELPHPNLVQSEGIALSAEGCGYAVISEAGPGGSTASMATVTCSG